ncbi:MAG: hypothetical protein H0W48_00425 [Methylibium sp.]|nr:hypothetical protein [Methylibium sp.]
MRRDLPSFGPEAPPALRAKLEAMREVLQVYLGYRGNELDRGVTVRDLTDGISLTGSGGSIVSNPAGTGATPDLTPPPTPTGLSAVAGFGTIFIAWGAAAYTLGHGPGQTNIYGAQWPEGAAAPTFSNAVLIGVAPHALSLYAHDTELGRRWAIWIKFQSADGIESTDPAGGINGAQATTGKIGNADLGPLVVTADKLSAGTYAGINMVPNPGAEDGTEGWAHAGEGVPVTFTADTSDKIGGSASFRILKPTIGTQTGYQCRAMPVIPGETYSLKLRLRTNVASAAGLYIRLNQKALAPVGGFVTFGLRDSLTDLVADGPSAATWTSYEFTYTAPPNVFWVSLAVYNWSLGSATTTWFDDVQFGRQITGSHLAAGSIVAGSAAIADGAIRRALIEIAAIDDARIANLSAAKLTVGDGTVGGNLRSTNYVANSAGWIMTPAGFFEAANATIRGNITSTSGSIAGNTITGSSITSPGFVAGSVGWQLTSAGVIQAASGNGDRQFNLAATGTSPVLKIGNALSILGNGVATFAGALSAANGTFAGSLSAASGTFSGSLLAASGTFSGSLTASAINAVNTINIGGNAVTIPVSAYTVGSIAFGGGADTVIQSAPIVSSGAPIIILGGAVITAAGDANGPATVVLKYFRSGILFLEIAVSVDGKEVVNLPPLRDTPGAGTWTYVLTARITSGSATGAATRALILLETKR